MVTCGILIHDDDGNFLSIFPYGAEPKSWTIPKGLPENSGETYVDAAIRECREECGLEFAPEKLVLIGVLPYLRHKSLCLFSTRVTDFPDLSGCLCTSFFRGEDGKEHPEVAGYGILNIERDRGRIGPSMYGTLAGNWKRILDEEEFYRTRFPWMGAS